MSIRIRIFAVLCLIFAVRSKAEHLMLDEDQGMSSVEVIEDNIGIPEFPDMIQIPSSMLSLPEDTSEPDIETEKEQVDKSSKESVKPGKESGKPGEDKKAERGQNSTDSGAKDQKSKSKKNNSNRDKSKKKSEGDATKHGKGKKHNHIKKKPEKGKKKADSDVTKPHNKAKSIDKATDINVEKAENTAKQSKPDEIAKTEDSDSKKDAKLSKKPDAENPEKGGKKSKPDKTDKPDDSQKAKSNVTDVTKVEGTQNKSTDKDKTVDETTKKRKSEKTKTGKNKHESDQKESVTDDSKTKNKDADTKKSTENTKKDSKKSKENAKSQEKSKSKLEKSRKNVQIGEKPDKHKTSDDRTQNADTEQNHNLARRSYDVESLKHICDDTEEAKTADKLATRAFVPIITNKPQPKPRRKKKKKAPKNKLLFGCESAKPKHITNFDGKGGIATIYSQSSKSSITVYCDNTTLGGGWTVFQRRVDGKLDFDRGYGAYQRGFGDQSGEHWLGLDAIDNITGKDEYTLRLEMTSANGKKMIANYNTFSVGSQAKGYRLKVDDFEGVGVKDVLKSYSGQKFSTFNQDETQSQCGSRLKSGFWFDNCSTSSPNGKYFIYPAKSRKSSGIEWKPPMAEKFGPIQYMEMKFRKKAEK